VAYTYAFVGLTPSERALLASIFELDAAEGDDLEQVHKPEEANLLIVNGDDHTVVQRLRDANPRALLVLVGRPPTADLQHLPVLRRPLDMSGVVQVLSSLEWPEPDLPSTLYSDFSGTFNPSSLLSSAPPTMPSSLPPHPVPPHPVPPPSRPRPEPMADPSAFAPTTATAPLDMSTAPAAVVAAAVAPPITAKTVRADKAAPAPSPAEAMSASVAWRTAEQASADSAPVAPTADEFDFANVPDHEDADLMLVLGAQGAKRHTLAQGLRRMGYRVRVVEGGERAAQLLQARPVPCLFLDQASLGDELMPLARMLHGVPTGMAKTPKLVIIARRDSVVHRLRARMMGWTWMNTPLNRERLTSFFARQGLRPSR